MARFISLHTLACLTRQGAEELTARLHGAAGLRTTRIVINLYQGKMLAEFEAQQREILEEYFRKEAIHFDWLMRVELEATDGVLKPAAT